MRSRRPEKAELLLISSSVLAVASGAFAVYSWIRRGVCTDAVVCATIAVLLAIGSFLLARRMSAVSRIRNFSNSPIYLVMVSEPKRDTGKKKEIRGKMPEDLDH